MKTLKKTFILLLLLLTLPASAQKFWSGEKYDICISLGANIGGTSPVPVPPTVEEIKNWRSGINPSFEVNTTFWHPKSAQWGLNTGLILEFKGMESVAMVKHFPVEMVVGGDARIRGFYTGENQTRVRNGYVTVPLQFAYRSKGRLGCRLGGFISYAGEKKFNGTVRKGGLREDLDSDVLQIEEENYDFSKEIRSFDAGVLMSGDVYLRNKMSAKLGFSWGVLPLFKSDFEGMKYALYNVYLNTALSYRW